MIVKIYGHSHACAKAIKGANWVKLYDAEGHQLLACEGISDFSGYSIEGGSWGTPPQDPRDLAIATLMREVAALKGGEIGV